jgi:hypothetical protein
LLVNGFGMVLFRVSALDGGIYLLHPIFSIVNGLGEKNKTLTSGVEPKDS